MRDTATRTVPVTPSKRNSPRMLVRTRPGLPSIPTDASAIGRPALESTTVPVTAPAWATTVGAASASTASATPPGGNERVRPRAARVSRCAMGPPSVPMNRFPRLKPTNCGGDSLQRDHPNGNHPNHGADSLGPFGRPPGAALLRLRCHQRRHPARPPTAGRGTPSGQRRRGRSRPPAVRARPPDSFDEPAPSHYSAEIKKRSRIHASHRGVSRATVSAARSP